MIRKIKKSVVMITVLSFISISFGTDWPQWRYDGNHSAVSPEQLPSQLNLQWVRDEGKPIPAWDNQKEVYSYGGPGVLQGQRVGFDIAHQPVVRGQIAFYNSVNEDKIVAVDLQTGAEKWRFYANGPIRFAPAVKNDKIYFGSDDGFLYCLNTANGELVWKYQAGPDNRTAMGNDRLISKWCVRGAPVLSSGAKSTESAELTAWLTKMRAASMNEFSIMKTDDDVEEYVQSGEMYTNSSDLELNYENTGKGAPQIIGMRFGAEFLRIPGGCTIDSAFIQFGVDETKAGTLPCTLLVEGEVSGNASAFTTQAYNLSSRPKTTAKVTWVVGPWTAVGQKGVEQRTPDIKAIIQEIVAQLNWSNTSSINIFIKGIGGDGIRCADASEENQITPKLLIYSSSIQKDSVTNRPKVVVTPDTDSNRVYFGSGLYPFEGTIIHALNNQTGELVWMNDGSSMYYTTQPHGTADGYSGLSPQGYLCLAGADKLLVPNGRATAACLNRTTGALVHFKFGETSYGGYHVVSNENVFYVREKAYNLSDGTAASPSSAPAISNENDVMIKAGTSTFTAGKLFEAMKAGATSTTVTNSEGFSSVVDGRAVALVAANGHLIVSTDAGKIYCYSQKANSNPPVIKDVKPSVRYPSSAILNARQILSKAKYKNGTKGICVVIGLKDSYTIEQLVLQSDITVIAFEEDAAKVKSLRKTLDALGMYGRRVHIVNQSFARTKLPSYIASIIYSELATLPESWNQELITSEVYRVLRPYGGTAFLNANYSLVKEVLKNDGNAVISGANPCEITKKGALAGTAPWTHVSANENNTNFVRDTTIKLPLGITWFGGSEDNTNDSILPRHGHGLVPLVAGGRIFQQGRDLLRAVDLYTGRVLWNKNIINLAQYSDNTAHMAGHLAIGGNLVVGEEYVYVLGQQNQCGFSTSCLMLDAATGETIHEFTLPDGVSWGMITVADSCLITTSDMLQFDPFIKDCYTTKYNDNEYYGPGDTKSRNGTYGTKLFVLDRFTGNVKWQANAKSGFYSYAMTTGKGKLYIVDNSNKQAIAVMSRYGAPVPTKTIASLTAYDLKSGTVIWKKEAAEDSIFGSHLGYSKEYDLLVEAFASRSDYYSDEKSNKLAVYNASTGAVIWKQLNRSYAGGPLMLDDTLIRTNGYTFNAINLLTGAFINKPNPLTGIEALATGQKHYGCTYATGAPNLLVVRSGGGGYIDIANNGGFGNFGGFKTGCTPQLIPAEGMIASPEYTRTCNCSYQMQTSCAMTNDPTVDIWLSNENMASQFKSSNGKISSIGLNFGAPGDRFDNSKNLFLEFPYGETAAGFSNYPIPVNVTVNSLNVKYVRHLSSRINGEYNWVAASGIEASGTITINMIQGTADADPQPYVVTLYLAETEGKSAGQRVFDVNVNGTTTGPIDIAAEVGQNKVLIKEIQGVIIGSTMTITLSAQTGTPLLCGIKAVRADLAMK